MDAHFTGMWSQTNHRARVLLSKKDKQLPHTTYTHTHTYGKLWEVKGLGCVQGRQCWWPVPEVNMVHMLISPQGLIPGHRV